MGQARNTLYVAQCTAAVINGHENKCQIKRVTTTLLYFDCISFVEKVYIDGIVVLLFVHHAWQTSTMSKLKVYCSRRSFIECPCAAPYMSAPRLFLRPSAPLVGE